MGYAAWIVIAIIIIVLIIFIVAVSCYCGKTRGAMVAAAIFLFLLTIFAIFLLFAMFAGTCVAGYVACTGDCSFF
jgi:hypothetical protein